MAPKALISIVDPGATSTQLVFIEETTLDTGTITKTGCDITIRGDGVYINETSGNAYFLRTTATSIPAGNPVAAGALIQAMIDNFTQATSGAAGTDDVNLIEVLGSALSPTNPVLTGEVPSAVNTFSGTTYSSSVLENNEVIKASPGTLYGFSGYNSGPEQFIQVFNATAIPADAAVPDISIKAGAANNFGYDSGKFGEEFSVGIVIVNSTTADVKTIGLADCLFRFNFE